jgi:nucleoside 2-deoxyribosyltransferase
MKLYVAGKWYDKEKIQEKMRELEQLNHKITHNWTVCETEYNGESARLRANAIDDIDGVKNADIVVVIMDDAKYPYRGTSHEVGAALALDKPVFLYCPDPENTEWYRGCFSRHPCIKLFRTWDDVKKKLGKIHSPPWTDAEEMARDNPTTFRRPILQGLRPGIHVKLSDGLERFWVKIVAREGRVFVGMIDNQLISEQDYGLNDLVRFERRHVYDIHL